MIAEAVWRLAGKAGLESVSLREVAAEAGVSMGRVQHYFRTKDAMLLYGLQLAQQRMEQRIMSRLVGAEASPEAVTRAAAEEMLSDDPDTGQAVRVSVAYLGRALEDPQVAELLFGDDAELHAGAEEAIRAAQAAGRASESVDPEHEAHILWSLANSLGIEVAFGQTDRETARARLHYYLDRIFGSHATVSSR